MELGWEYGITPRRYDFNEIKLDCLYTRYLALVIDSVVNGVVVEGFLFLTSWV